MTQTPSSADWLDSVWQNLKFGLSLSSAYPYPVYDVVGENAWKEAKQAIEAHIKELLDEAKHCSGCGKYVSYCDECQRLWQT